MGGLGNYMFQISAGYVHALNCGVDFVVNTKHIQKVHGDFNNYTDNIFSRLQIDNTFTPKQMFREPRFEYSPIPIFDSETMIYGYFQSEKYFNTHRHKIIDLFVIPDDIKNTTLLKYPELTTTNTCSIHVRRGDYLKLSDIHPPQTVEYYKNAVDIIGKNHKFFIFSDDIVWCEQNLSFISDGVFCKNNKDFEDLYLMSLCRHNIIANSSFSWWGAWLNKNNDKKIIAPKKWFGDKHIYSDKDLIPERWIKI